MATLNGVKAIFSGRNPSMEENVTQSLEHIVLNTIKQKVKQVKKGHDESVLPNIASSHSSLSATLPELHACLGKWRDAGRGKVNQSTQSETRTEVSKTININGTEPQFGKVVPTYKTITNHDLSIFPDSAGEKATVAGGLHGQAAVIALQERRDTPLSHVILSQVADTDVLPSTNVPLETLSPRAEREHSSSAFPLTSDAQHRTRWDGPTATSNRVNTQKHG
ncbi:MAG: hypothetical protein ACMZI0_03735 [Symbiopectobacterium sp.]|uniref:hypothetical protein n=1 Tax=Symbiopectobacterium sp. TaxID=2952789 RepID=UPI0039EA6BA1